MKKGSECLLKSRIEQVFHLLEVAIISILGGTFFYLLHIPLPWMLGPLAFTMSWKMITKRKLYWPIKLRDTGLMILGYLLGSSFTDETLLKIITQLPSMLLITILTIVFSLFIGYVIARGSQVDIISAIIGSVPGGLSQMVLIGEETKEANTTIITFMQTFRLMAVIFVVPFLIVHGFIEPNELNRYSQALDFEVSALPMTHFLYFGLVVLAGAIIGRMINLPSAPLLGPLIGTAMLLLSGIDAPPLPPLLVIISQIFVGAHMGLIMNLTSLANWKKLAPYTAGGNLVLIFFSLGLAWLLTVWHPMSIISAFLGTSPGGVAEMGVFAQEVRADLSMVTAYQLFRVFFLLFFMPPLLKWWIKKQSRNELPLSRSI
jgi:membrane AbrB-like protein